MIDRDDDPAFKKEMRAYMARIGTKGGSTRGAKKKRGDKNFYKELSAKALEARWGVVKGK